MNKLDHFPLNYIKEDKSVIFWLAFERLKTMYYAKNELPKEWLELLFDSAILLPMKFEGKSKAPTPITRNDLHKEITKYLGKQLLKSDDHHSKLLKFVGSAKRISSNYLNCKMINDDPMNGIRALITGFSLVNLVLDADKGAAITPSKLEDQFYSDIAMHNWVINNKKGENLYLLKGDQIRKIFVLATDNFQDRTKYFRIALTGCFCGLVGILDSEEKFNTSARDGNYNEYWQNSVKPHVKGL